MSPTQKADRWDPNRQRQVGACIQQVETDGDTFSTGRDRRGQDLIGTQNVTCAQQVKTGAHQVETEIGIQQQRQMHSSERQPESVRPKQTDRYPGETCRWERCTDTQKVRPWTQGQISGFFSVCLRVEKEVRGPSPANTHTWEGRPVFVAELSPFLWDFLPRPGGVPRTNIVGQEGHLLSVIQWL